MSIRGVSFKIPQDSNNILELILGKINVCHYYWTIEDGQNEIWSIPEYHDFFDNNIYEGHAFWTKMKQPHKVLFLKLQAYSNKIVSIPSKISSYKEFMNSDCILIILIYDCEFVDIYVKNTNDLLSILLCAYENNFSYIRLITNENDERVGMDIL